MKKGIGSICAAAAVAAILAAGSLAAAAPEAETVTILRRGKALFEERCRLCHSLQLPLSKVKSRDEWTQTVKRMVLYGAAIPGDGREGVAAYLTAQSTFTSRCGDCHDRSRAVMDGKGPAVWSETVSRMAAHMKELEAAGATKGAAPLTGEEIDLVAAFLEVVIGRE